MLQVYVIGLPFDGKKRSLKKKNVKISRIKTVQHPYIKQKAISIQPCTDSLYTSINSLLRILLWSVAYNLKILNVLRFGIYPITIGWRSTCIGFRRQFFFANNWIYIKELACLVFYLCSSNLWFLVIKRFFNIYINISVKLLSITSLFPL